MHIVLLSKAPIRITESQKNEVTSTHTEHSPGCRFVPQEYFGNKAAKDRQSTIYSMPKPCRSGQKSIHSYEGNPSSMHYLLLQCLAGPNVLYIYTKLSTHINKYAPI